jgi:hypothetical protein
MQGPPDAGEGGGKERRKATIDSLQKDIETGNSYRMEALKQMLTLATALLAFTVSFRPTLKAVNQEWLIFYSWLALGISIVSGIAIMMCWERFYLAYRLDWHDKAKEGENRRDQITLVRRLLLLLQLISFAFGTLGVAIFAGLNFTNVVASSH